MRHSPCTTAIVGHGRSSTVCARSSSEAVSASAFGTSSPWNTCTSTPAVNTFPSARTISARGGSAAARSTAARNSSISVWSNRFSGGLARTISPTSPSVS